MNIASYVDMTRQSLRLMIEQQKTRIDDLERVVSDKTAEGVPSVAYADLPVASDGMLSPALRWVTDGRKIGESASNGTGVLAYYDPTSDAWNRISDDTAVAT